MLVQGEMLIHLILVLRIAEMELILEYYLVMMEIPRIWMAAIQVVKSNLVGLAVEAPLPPKILVLKTVEMVVTTKLISVMTAIQ